MASLKGKENKTTKGLGRSGAVKSSEHEIIPYQRQYSHVYSYRLSALKDRVWKQLKTLSPPPNKSVRSVQRILELPENCLSDVVGTVIVERMNANSDENYYRDESLDEQEDKQLHPKSACRSCDQLYLEDESGRVAIRFGTGTETETNNDDQQQQQRNHVYQYCTGAVVGLRGTVDDRGTMHVQNIVNPVLVPPSSSSSSAANDDSESEPEALVPHLLLVSSLCCGDPDVSSLPREMLVSYLQGQFDADNAAKVARVIVAGSGPGVAAVDDVTSSSSTLGLKEFDIWGLQVTRTAGIPLDIMPSATDPTSRNWPQRPLHSSLLPNTLRSNTTTTTAAATGSGGSDNAGYHATAVPPPMARMAPNPYEAIYGNKLVLGTDGLNVRDLQKHILKPPPLPTDDDHKDSMDGLSSSSLPASPQQLTELESLEQTLRWAHLCPTGPSSENLGMVPSGDPMVMNRATPDVYFCGNCDEGFQTKLLYYDHNNDHKKTRLICIPKFYEMGEAVLVNLQTLDVEVLKFKTN